MNSSVASSADVAILDNPIWNSLTTTHAGFAVGNGLARRYATEIGPLSGLSEPTDEALAALAALVPAGDVAVLFLEERIKFPANWQVVFAETLVQMISTSVPEEQALVQQIVPLGPEDFSEMIALAKLTEPGPFRERTATLGGFIGIRVNGRLAAMAGQRLSPTGFSEVSAVCTHPEFRGRGFARALVASVARNIYAADTVPFLTALATNTGAIGVYEQVGFVIRRRFHLAVLKPALNN